MGRWLASLSDTFRDVSALPDSYQRLEGQTEAVVKNCTVSIELDDDEDGHRADDLLGGYVRMSASDEVRSGRLFVVAEWRSDGSETYETCEVARQAIPFEGLETGEESLYSFTLDLPPGPYTYSGEEIQLGWVVRVEVDAPEERGDTVEEPFVLRPGASSDYNPGRSSIRELLGVKDEHKIHLRFFPLPLLLGTAGVAILVSAATQASGVQYGQVCLSSMFILPSLLIGYFMARKWRGDSAMGDRELELSESVLEAGDTLSWKIPVPTDDDIESAKVEMLGREYVREVPESGSKSRTLRTEVHRRMRDGLEHADSEDGWLSGEFDVPETTAYSMDLGERQRVRWVVVARIDFVGFGTWRESRNIVVRP